MTTLKTFSVIGYAVSVLALVALFYFHAILSWSPFIITIQLLAIALMVWARMTFGWRSFHYAANPTKGGLITSGPYRFIRHPIYAAIMYFAIAGVAGNLSWPSAAMLAVVCLGSGVRIFCEERLLIADYPEYTEYAQRTKRLMPYVF